MLREGLFRYFLKGSLLGWMTLLFALAGGFTVVSPALGADIRFCRVVLESERASMAAQKYVFSPGNGQPTREVWVAQTPDLTQADIKSVAIIKREDAPAKEHPIIDIYFSPSGAEKLLKLSQDNLRREIAILVSDQIWQLPYVVYPLKQGLIRLFSKQVDTDDKAAKFVESIGFSPIFINP